MTESCTRCGYPTRRLWSYLTKPGFTDIAVEHWMALQQCPCCRQLWCDVPHEPYTSFDFYTAWPSTEKEWRRLIEIDGGIVLHEWHDAVIREDFSNLPEEERKAVEWWRDRTYRHYNPIDRGPDEPKPKYCQVSSDLLAYLK